MNSNVAKCSSAKPSTLSMLHAHPSRDQDIFCGFIQDKRQKQLREPRWLRLNFTGVNYNYRSLGLLPVLPVHNSSTEMKNFLKESKGWTSFHFRVNCCMIECLFYWTTNCVRQNSGAYKGTCINYSWFLALPSVIFFSGVWTFSIKLSTRLKQFSVFGLAFNTRKELRGLECVN